MGLTQDIGGVWQEVEHLGRHEAAEGPIGGRQGPRSIDPGDCRVLAQRARRPVAILTIV
jgi:hypothetical protein